MGGVNCEANELRRVNCGGGVKRRPWMQARVEALESGAMLDLVKLLTVGAAVVRVELELV